jgi:hypothetical protein
MLTNNEYNMLVIFKDSTDPLYFTFDNNHLSVASYGGYAVLAGLAFTPDLYACGVDYVGVSNILELRLKTRQPEYFMKSSRQSGL